MSERTRTITKTLIDCVIKKGLRPEDNPATYNFDHPDAFDFDLMVDTLRYVGFGVEHYRKLSSRSSASVVS